MNSGMMMWAGQRRRPKLNITTIVESLGHHKTHKGRITPFGIRSEAKLHASQLLAV